MQLQNWESLMPHNAILYCTDDEDKTEITNSSDVTDQSDINIDDKKQVTPSEIWQQLDPKIRDRLIKQLSLLAYKFILDRRDSKLVEEIKDRDKNQDLED